MVSAASEGPSASTAVQTSAKNRYFSSLTPNLNAPTSITVHSAILCVALTGQRTSRAACSEGVALGYDVTALRADRSGRRVMARQRRVLTAKRGIAVSWRLLRGKSTAGAERRKPSGADPAAHPSAKAVAASRISPLPTVNAERGTALFRRCAHRHRSWRKPFDDDGDLIIIPKVFTRTPTAVRSLIITLYNVP